MVAVRSIIEFDLTDIQRIIVRCGKCGFQFVAVPVQTPEIPIACPSLNCKTDWAFGPRNGSLNWEGKSGSLQRLWTDLAELARKAPVRVTVEIDAAGEDD